MTRRFGALAAAASVLATAGVFALSGAAHADGSLPTLTVALKGVSGVSVSGSEVSGAVSITATFTGKAPSGPNSNGPSFGIVRLDPGVTIQQAAGAVNASGGDLNALDPLRQALRLRRRAPATVQTVLTPGNYVALNDTGNGQPGFAPFTVTQSTSPAALPAAAATQTAIEFGFRGPTVLHDGTLVRARNGGYLVHMIFLFRAPHESTALQVMALLKAGEDNQAMQLLGPNPAFVGLLGPASPGAMQQQVLNAPPGLLRRGLLHGYPGRSGAHPARDGTPCQDRGAGKLETHSYRLRHPAPTSAQAQSTKVMGRLSPARRSSEPVGATRVGPSSSRLRSLPRVASA